MYIPRRLKLSAKEIEVIKSDTIDDNIDKVIPLYII